MGAMIMNMKKFEGIITILKYLDNDFISDEQYEIICNLDINNQEQQNQIIRTTLLPNFREFNEITQHSIKKLMEECLQDKEATLYLDKLFISISMPFESEITDKRAFLQNVFEELFREC